MTLWPHYTLDLMEYDSETPLYPWPYGVWLWDPTIPLTLWGMTLWPHYALDLMGYDSVTPLYPWPYGVWLCDPTIPLILWGLTLTRELLWYPLEKLLDGGGVADECGGHLESTRRDVTHGRLDVVRYPLHEVRAVLVLHVQQLLVNLCKVTPYTQVTPTYTQVNPTYTQVTLTYTQVIPTCTS